VAREHFLQFVERLARKKGGPALLLVTHHVEEITPAFTHALLLKDGAVQTQGPSKPPDQSNFVRRVWRADETQPPPGPLYGSSRIVSRRFHDALETTRSTRYLKVSAKNPRIAAKER